MYAFAVLGDDAERAAERLVADIEERVGVVRVGDAATGDGTTAGYGQTEYALDERWRATGEGLSLPDVLDRLAPDHEYAVVLGDAAIELPTIAVGDGIENAVFEVEDATNFDTGTAIDAVRGTEPHETLESLVAAVKRSQSADYAGAIATFTGRVRAKEGAEDDRTHYLEFEKYEGVAARRMETIETELEARDGILDVRLHHRTGRIPDGEDIVFVVVLAGHRREAFRAVEDGIDRLKDEVPLFKKEVTDDETFWVHEREL